mmetsp:Transcript_41625/g.54827  ORF Transcript_41625/g.54827 Transcript_41625/m.54827 type:complete len:140 (+) Transcript_41625:25-444(+)
MSLSLFACGLGVLESWNLMAFIMIIVFISSFNSTTGAVSWLYIPEVCVDAATGLAVASQFLNLTIISFTFEFMINSELQVHGSIWYFSALNFIGFLFCLCFVKETRGLADVQKKTLYSPIGTVEISAQMAQLKDSKEAS